jgi:hypothetical protein
MDANAPGDEARARQIEASWCPAGSTMSGALRCSHNIPGAQTERRGGAGPVGSFLGGKDPTGPLF